MSYRSPTRELIRSVTFTPYREGLPTFRLDVYAGAFGQLGDHTRMGYRLAEIAPDETETTVFDGTDFGCPPHQTMDGNATIRGIMTFLSLRRGDTDAGYFEGYTSAQLAFAEEHGEILSLIASDPPCHWTRTPHEHCEGDPMCPQAGAT